MDMPDLMNSQCLIWYRPCYFPQTFTRAIHRCVFSPLYDELTDFPNAMDWWTCLIWWTDRHAWFDELTDMPDLMPTFLLTRAVHRCLYSLQRLFLYGLMDFVIETLVSMNFRCIPITSTFYWLIHSDAFLCVGAWACVCALAHACERASVCVRVCAR